MSFIRILIIVFFISNPIFARGYDVFGIGYYDVKFDGRLVGLEVKAQKQGGTVDEKLMYSVFKYSKNYDEIVFLLHPLFRFRLGIKESMEFVAKHKKLKLTFLWGVEDLSNYLAGKIKNQETILNFCQ